jgi:hypothetical protein
LSYARDLIVLVAHNDTRQSIEVLLKRSSALGIRPISLQLVKHPNRDPGCYQDAQEILRSYIRDTAHALVVFDHEGSGRETSTRDRVEEDVRNRLAKNGWEARAETIVIAPELESWAWVNLQQLEGVLRWPSSAGRLSDWLRKEGFLADGDTKPSRPKEALRAILRVTRRPVSAAIFGSLASTLSFSSCADPAFSSMLGTLRRWFPPPS